MYALLMLSNPLKMIKMHQYVSEFCWIGCRNIMSTLVHLLVLLYESFKLSFYVLYLPKCKIMLHTK